LAAVWIGYAAGVMAERTKREAGLKARLYKPPTTNTTKATPS
jgi:hypothetical protein